MKQSCITSSRIGVTIFIFIIVSLLLSPAHSAYGQSIARTEEANELVTFSAVLQTDGVVVEWQVAGSALAWNYVVYRSLGCAWEDAQSVNGPMFSSIDSESGVAAYSLTDTESGALASCHYWLIGTDESGAAHQYGPYQVEGRFGVYLPLIARG